MGTAGGWPGLGVCLLWKAGRARSPPSAAGACAWVSTHPPWLQILQPPWAELSYPDGSASQGSVYSRHTLEMHRINGTLQAIGLAPKNKPIALY